MFHRIVNKIFNQHLKLIKMKIKLNKLYKIEKFNLQKIKEIFNQQNHKIHNILEKRVKVLKGQSLQILKCMIISKYTTVKKLEQLGIEFILNIQNN